MGRKFLQNCRREKVHAGAYANVYLPLNWACSAHTNITSTFKQYLLWCFHFVDNFFGFYCYGRRLLEIFIEKNPNPMDVMSQKISIEKKEFFFSS